MMCVCSVLWISILISGTFVNYLKLFDSLCEHFVLFFHL